MEIRNEHCSWTRPCDHVTVQFDRSTENTMNRVFFPLKCTRGPDDALTIKKLYMYVPLYENRGVSFLSAAMKRVD